MKKKKPKSTKQKEKQITIQPEEDKAKSPDFGGIPSRDIKKNLGCG
jgi:hypothetical protein